MFANLSHVLRKMVPKLLTDKQNPQSVSSASVPQHPKDVDGWNLHFIYEWWHGEQSVQWMQPIAQISGKVVVIVEFMQQRKTTITDVCETLWKQSRGLTAIQNKMCGMLTYGVAVLRDIAALAYSWSFSSSAGAFQLWFWTLLWYDADLIQNHKFDNSFILVCVLFIAVTCLPSRWLATI
jgi:hypothetical protein